MTRQNVKSFFSVSQKSSNFRQKVVKKHLIFRPIVTEKNAPLGIYTKLHVMPENKGFADFKNVTNYFNVTNFLHNSNNLNSVSLRMEKFALQDKSRQILTQKIQRGDKWAYVHRVNYCLRFRIDKNDGVKLFYNREREKAQYGNLQRCCSVWNCPVCASAITEARREELKLGLQNWKDSGGFCYLVTFTNRHYSGMNLAHLLSGQKKAFVKFWSKTKVVQMLAKLGYVGRIVATECTYSDNNGWHPHYHMIFFFKQEINQQALQSFLAVEWQDVSVKVGLPAPTIKHGVDVRNGTYAAQYVSKWGLDHELTKGHVKTGLNGSLTPFDLLRVSNGSDNYAELFREFADAFKGKQQLHWSNGLKGLLEIEQKSDAEIITDTEKTSDFVRELTVQIWCLVLTYDARADVLDLVEQDYLDGGGRLDEFIMSLAQRYVNDMHIRCT